MKRKKIALTAFILITGVLVLTLSSCSGVLGGDSSVRISVDELSGSRSSRYISGNADSGYVVVMQKDRIYSLNNFSDRAYYQLQAGNVYISNLPVGNFIFGIVLTDNMDTPDNYDDDDVYGLAIKEIKIKKGFNDVLIDVGPGIDTFETDDGLDLSEFLLPDGFGVSFATDTIIFETDDTSNINFAFSEGLGADTLTGSGGTVTSTEESPLTGQPYTLTILRQ